jgi:hypothetical protein
MKFLPKLFENNRAWAEKNKREDPDYFEQLSRTQSQDRRQGAPTGVMERRFHLMLSVKWKRNSRSLCSRAWRGTRQHSL